MGCEKVDGEESSARPEGVGVSYVHVRLLHDRFFYVYKPCVIYGGPRDPEERFEERERERGRHHVGLVLSTENLSTLFREWYKYNRQPRPMDVFKNGKQNNIWSLDPIPRNTKS